MRSLIRPIWIWILIVQLSGAPATAHAAGQMISASIALLDYNPCKIDRGLLRGKDSLTKLLNLIEFQNRHLDKAFMNLRMMGESANTLFTGPIEPSELIKKSFTTEECVADLKSNIETAITSGHTHFKSAQDNQALVLFQLQSYITHLQNLTLTRAQLREYLSDLISRRKINSTLAEVYSKLLQNSTEWQSKYDIKIPAKAARTLTGFDQIADEEMSKAFKTILQNQDTLVNVDPSSIDELYKGNGTVKLRLNRSTIKEIDMSVIGSYTSEAAFVRAAKILLASHFTQQMEMARIMMRNPPKDPISMPSSLIAETASFSDWNASAKELERAEKEPEYRSALYVAAPIMELARSSKVPDYDAIDAHQRKKLNEQILSAQNAGTEFSSDLFMTGLLKHAFVSHIPAAIYKNAGLEPPNPPAPLVIPAETRQKIHSNFRIQEHLKIGPELKRFIDSYPFALNELNSEDRATALSEIFANAKLEAIKPMVRSVLTLDENKPYINPDANKDLEEFLGWYTRQWAKNLSKQVTSSWTYAAEQSKKSEEVQNERESTLNQVANALTSSAVKLKADIAKRPGDLPVRLDALKKALEIHINGLGLEAKSEAYLDVVFSQANYSTAAKAFRIAMGKLRDNKSKDVQKFYDFGLMLAFTRDWPASAEPTLKEIPLGRDKLGKELERVREQIEGKSELYRRAYLAFAKADPILTAPVGSGGTPLYESLIHATKLDDQNKRVELVDKAARHVAAQIQKAMTAVDQARTIKDLLPMILTSPLFHQAMAQSFPTFAAFLDGLKEEATSPYRPKSFWQKADEGLSTPFMLLIGFMGAQMAVSAVSGATKVFTQAAVRSTARAGIGSRLVGGAADWTAIGSGRLLFGMNRTMMGLHPFYHPWARIMMYPIMGHLGHGAYTHRMGLTSGHKQLETVKDLFYTSATAGGLFNYFDILDAEDDIDVEQGKLVAEAKMLGFFMVGIPLATRAWNAGQHFWVRMRSAHIESRAAHLGLKPSEIGVTDAAIDSAYRARLKEIARGDTNGLDPDAAKILARKSAKALKGYAKKTHAIEAWLKKTHQGELRALETDSLKFSELEKNLQRITQETDTILSSSNRSPLFQSKRDAAIYRRQKAIDAYRTLTARASMMHFQSLAPTLELRIWGRTYFKSNPLGNETSWVQSARANQLFEIPLSGAQSRDFSAFVNESGKTHYEILGVDKNATTEEIVSAFRKLAKANHPDVNPNNPEANARFVEIGQSYGVLNNAESRKAYDEYIGSAP